MPRVLTCWLLVLLAAVPACTDWDGKGGQTGAQLQPGGLRAGIGDGGATADGGLAYLETWQPPSLDAASDATLVVDTIAAPDVAPADDATATAAADAAAAPDLAVYTLDGKGDFVGWPELPAADASATDAAAGDGSTADTPPPTDGGADGGPADAEPADAQPADAAPDGGGGDVGSSDVGAADSGIAADSLTDSAGLTDAAAADTGGGGVPVSPDGTTTLPDGAALPDWQGYGDLPFADGEDIYGGAINSCLALYLYQTESCGAIQPTSACIDSAAEAGSLYAQFLFEPLQQCEKAVCVGLCQGASDKTCWEQCIAKYCPAQFFACTSNAQQGTQSCGEAWSCAAGFADKLLTISSKCYAAASATAQLQLSAVIACVTAPQQASCVPQIASCYGGGPASDASCAGSLQCLGGCNNDQACVGACLGKASPQAVQLLDTAIGCLTLQCAPQCKGDKACEDSCASTTCKNAFAACAAN